MTYKLFRFRRKHQPVTELEAAIEKSVEHMNNILSVKISESPERDVIYVELWAGDSKAEQKAELIGLVLETDLEEYMNSALRKESGFIVKHVSTLILQDTPRALGLIVKAKEDPQRDKQQQPSKKTKNRKDAQPDAAAQNTGAASSDESGHSGDL